MTEASSDYYRRMRNLALEKRQYFGLTTPEIGLETVRKMYKAEGIVLDPWRGKLRKLKAAYFYDECGASVMYDPGLPMEPRLFALVHELKHHYEDKHLLRAVCHEVSDKSPLVEIGAEVFAAEFIFPEVEFQEFVLPWVRSGKIQPRDVVDMMYWCPAKVSYQFLTKTLGRLGYIRTGEFDKVKFHILHREAYGAHYYRAPRISRLQS